LKGHAVNDSQLQPLAYSPDKAAIRIGKSTRSVYELIARGEIRSYRDGKRRLIPDTELQNYVQRKLTQALAA
jgi:excisionase family DNA binding protein